jgi:hypothetical protein
MLARPVVAAWTKQTLTDHFFKEAKVCHSRTKLHHTQPGEPAHAAATVKQQWRRHDTLASDHLLLCVREQQRCNGSVARIIVINRTAMATYAMMLHRPAIM